MKIIFLFIIPIIVGLTLSFPFILESTQLTLSDESYAIEIYGLEEDYQIGDYYSFYFTISGFGYDCGTIKVSFPDKDGVITGQAIMPQCVSPRVMNEFLIDSRDMGFPLEVKRPIPNKIGTYYVMISFEHAGSTSTVFDVHPYDVQESDFVKNCIAVGPDGYVPDVEIVNGTHGFNLRNCEWEYVVPATNSINKWPGAPIYKEQKENEN